MGNYCPSCTKFVSLETQDPEENSVEISEDGNVTMNVTINRVCAECGGDMKTLDLEAEMDVDDQFISEHSGDSLLENGHGEWEVETDGEPTLTESGGGRYAKNLIGFEADVTVTCKCGGTTSVHLSAEEAASSFEDLN